MAETAQDDGVCISAALARIEEGFAEAAKLVEEDAPQDGIGTDGARTAERRTAAIAGVMGATEALAALCLEHSSATDDDAEAKPLEAHAAGVRQASARASALLEALLLDGAAATLPEELPTGWAQGRRGPLLGRASEERVRLHACRLVHKGLHRPALAALRALCAAARSGDDGASARPRTAFAPLGVVAGMLRAGTSTDSTVAAAVALRFGIAWRSVAALKDGASSLRELLDAERREQSLSFGPRGADPRRDSLVDAAGVLRLLEKEQCLIGALELELRGALASEARSVSAKLFDIARDPHHAKALSGEHAVGPLAAVDASLTGAGAQCADLSAPLLHLFEQIAQEGQAPCIAEESLARAAAALGVKVGAKGRLTALMALARRCAPLPSRAEERSAAPQWDADAFVRFVTGAALGLEEPCAFHGGTVATIGDLLGAIRGSDAGAAFARLDTDGSGVLPRDLFASAVQECGAAPAAFLLDAIAERFGRDSGRGRLAGIDYQGVLRFGRPTQLHLSVMTPFGLFAVAMKPEESVAALRKKVAKRLFWQQHNRNGPFREREEREERGAGDGGASNGGEGGDGAGGGDGDGKEDGDGDGDGDATTRVGSKFVLARHFGTLPLPQAAMAQPLHKFFSTGDTVFVYDPARQGGGGFKYQALSRRAAREGPPPRVKGEAPLPSARKARAVASASAAAATASRPRRRKPAKGSGDETARGATARARAPTRTRITIKGSTAPMPSGEHLDEWSHADALAWLTSVVQLPQYLPALRRVRADGGELLRLAMLGEASASELADELDTASALHLRKISLHLSRIAADFLRRAEASRHGRAPHRWTKDHVMSWLHRAGLGVAGARLRRSGVRGGALLGMDEAQLCEDHGLTKLEATLVCAHCEELRRRLEGGGDGVAPLCDGGRGSGGGRQGGAGVNY